MVNWYLIVSLLFGLLGMSTTVPGPGAPPPMPQAQAPLGAAFDLPYGAGVEVDNALELAFAGVVEDSRCARDATCVWAGRVVVEVAAQAGNQPVQTVRLGGFTDMEGQIGGPASGPDVAATAVVEAGSGESYTVELLAVQPYPAQATAPPAEADYTLTLKVSKSDSQGSSQGSSQGGTAQPTATPAAP